MPRPSTIESHPQSREINHAIVDQWFGKTSYRRIAAQFDVSETSLRRQSEKLKKRLRAEIEANQWAEVEYLRVKVEIEVEDIQTIKREAWAKDDLALALAACDRALKAYEIEARFRRSLEEERSTNIFITPEWVQFKAIVIGTLEEHHPEALEDVLLSIHSAGLTRVAGTLEENSGDG